MWWRVFIPTWRFFDQVGSAPTLFFKTSGDWLPLRRPLRKGWNSLFFNPVGNFSHAQNNLMERLLLESQTSSHPEELISYKLLEEIIREHLRKQKIHPPNTSFQFKLMSQDEDALISAPLTL